MTMHRRRLLLVLLLLMPTAHAEDDLRNRGHDPFFQISSAIPGCPEPAGPRVGEAEWKRESHHRIEHGNHCWVEGRCRLPNAFAYDEEIADSTRRRAAMAVDQRARMAAKHHPVGDRVAALDAGAGLRGAGLRGGAFDRCAARGAGRRARHRRDDRAPRARRAVRALSRRGIPGRRESGRGWRRRQEAVSGGVCQGRRVRQRGRHL